MRTVMSIMTVKAMYSSLLFICIFFPYLWPVTPRPLYVHYWRDAGDASSCFRRARPAQGPAALPGLRGSHTVRLQDSFMSDDDHQELHVSGRGLEQPASLAFLCQAGHHSETPHWLQYFASSGFNAWQWLQRTMICVAA